MKKVSILQNIEYSESKPVVSILMETDFTKEIRIVFKQNQQMKEHQTPFPITVEIVDGKIDFGVNGDIHKLKKGDLISLSGNVPHNLSAIVDSIVRLTLSKGDQVNRVEKVVSQ